MKIVIVGGTGFIGRNIEPVLTEGGNIVTILTRDHHKAKTIFPTGIRVQEWDPVNWGKLENFIQGQDAVINLAGASIAEGRWTSSRKAFLRSSRINTTRTIVNALSNLPITVRPKILISASGVGYYGIETANAVDELARPGTGFLADLCVEWEAEAFRATDYGVRTVCLRISMVLGKDGGALQKMLLPFKLFLGGPVGHGTQPVSWIHAKDLAMLIKTILENDSFKGPINACAPQEVMMKELCQQIGTSLGRPCWLPVPTLALKLGLGEMSTLMTHGQKVSPFMAQKLGFTFKYSDLESALASILGKAS